MGTRSHKSVLASVDHLAGRAMRQAGERYRKDIKTLIAAVKNGRSLQDVKRKLSPAMVKQMGTDAIGEALGNVGVQAALIGNVGAKLGKTSKSRNVETGKVKKSKRRNVETSKRQNVETETLKPER